MNATHIKLIRICTYVESSPEVIRIVPLIFVPRCITDTCSYRRVVNTYSTSFSASFFSDIVNSLTMVMIMMTCVILQYFYHVFWTFIFS